MRRAALLFIMTSLLAMPAGASALSGATAVKLSDYPWTVALRTRDNDRFFCGGSLVASRWVLTAAHCADAVKADNIAVVSGREDQSSTKGGTKVTVDRVVIHPEYSRDCVISGGSQARHCGADIALLRLETTIRVATAPLSFAEIAEETPIRILGWGTAVTRTTPAKKLERIDVTSRSIKTCESVIGLKVVELNDRLLCVGDENPFSPQACPGDSGSPVLRKRDDGRFEQVAVVSVTHMVQGTPCLRLGAKSAHVRVAPFEAWIRETTGGLGGAEPAPGGSNVRRLLDAVRRWWMAGP